MTTEPPARPLEARHQTQHKLETMERYWRLWCQIIAAADARSWCNRRLWLIDTMAGTGTHLSENDPDQEVPGTPWQATLAAVTTQRHFPLTAVAVRATDIDAGYIARLEARVRAYRGDPPDRVDVRVERADWIRAVPQITAEIAREGHPSAARPSQHEHRSLWFIDPFGIEPLDHRTIVTLPRHAEVIVNFDENGARRDAGRELPWLDRVFGDDSWRKAVGQPTGAFARAFAEGFPRFEFRNIYTLRPSGAQDRFFVHLVDSRPAVRAFAGCVSGALRADTVIAGAVLSGPQKHRAAIALHELYAGLTLSIDELRAASTTYSRAQLRAIVQTADDEGYGRWRPSSASIEWFDQRLEDPTLNL